MPVLRRLLVFTALAACAHVAAAQKLGTIELGAFAHYTKVNNDSLLGSSSSGVGLRGGLFLFKYLEAEAEYGIGSIKGNNARYKEHWYPQRVFATANIPVTSRAKLLLGIGHNDQWKGDVSFNQFEEGISALLGLRICFGDAWSLRPEFVYDKNPGGPFKAPVHLLPGEPASTHYQFRVGISRFFLRGANTCRGAESAPAKAPPPTAAPPVAAAPPPARPTATLLVTPTAINAGQSATLTWSSAYATSCTGPWMSGSAISGTQSVSPGSTTDYTITCTGPGGSATSTTNLTVRPAPPPPPPPTPAPPPRELYQLMGANFDFDKATLKPVGKAKLDSAVTVLNQFPDMRVEVQGHTDSVGTLDYNQALSERRAKAAVDYLVSKGIAASRLVPRGYSKTQPIATNDTPEGRALNRRVMLIEIRQ